MAKVSFVDDLAKKMIKSESKTPLKKDAKKINKADKPESTPTRKVVSASNQKIIAKSSSTQAARRTGRRIVLVLDNGSAHTSRRSLGEIERVKDLIKIFWLPTYTSEQLNDIEGLWKHLKEDYFSRMLVEDPAMFRDAVVHLLDQMRRGRKLREVLKPRHTIPVRKNLVVPA